MPYLRKLSKNQTALVCNIPREVRDALDLRFGDYVLFCLTDSGFVTLHKVDLEKRPDLKQYQYFKTPTHDTANTDS